MVMMKAGPESRTTKVHITYIHFRDTDPAYFIQLTLCVLAIIDLIYLGEIGFVPKSYLELLIRKEGRPQLNNANDFMGQPLLPLGLSFSSVDYITPTNDFQPLESIPEVTEIF